MKIRFPWISKMSAFFILAFFHTTSAARILAIFPIPSVSHRNLYVPLIQELLHRSHDVTVVTPYEDVFNVTKGSYKTVQLTGFVEWMNEGLKALGSFEKAERNPFHMFQSTIEVVTKITEMSLAHKNVQKLIHSKENFDLVIMLEGSNHAHKALSAYFGVPLVLFTTLGSSCLTNLVVGNPAPPSYIPDMFLGYSPQMTFFERLTNSIMLVYVQMYTHWYVYPQHNELIKKYIPGRIELDQVLYNTSLVLLNSHPSVNQPVPHLPNMVEIGGFHIKPPKKLPIDLQRFIDNASYGVIYFSMGSNLKSSDLEGTKRDVFLRTFAKLKQKVIWKWEENILPRQPANLKVGKWMPQQDILAHPNVRLFITHGGHLSITESIYHGVPVLVIPIFMDQKLNSKSVVNVGLGLSLSLDEVSEHSLTSAIGELINNSKYKEHVQLRSTYFRDRLSHPMETAIYWIEYIITHRGAPHLRVAGIELPWYKYLLLDVIGFLLVLLLLILSTFTYLFRIMCFRKRIKLKMKQK